MAIVPARFDGKKFMAKYGITDPRSFKILAGGVLVCAAFPDLTDNDLLDCVVGCCVGASYRGCDPNIQQVLAQGAQNTGRRGGLKYQHHEV